SCEPLGQHPMPRGASAATRGCARPWLARALRLPKRSHANAGATTQVRHEHTPTLVKWGRRCVSSCSQSPIAPRERACAFGPLSFYPEARRGGGLVCCVPQKPDSATRASVRLRTLELLTGSPSATDARIAMTLIDSSF